MADYMGQITFFRSRTFFVLGSNRMCWMSSFLFVLDYVVWEDASILDGLLGVLETVGLVFCLSIVVL